MSARSESSPVSVPGSPGRRVVLGITGGIAAYKCAELVRLLGKAGHVVDVILTDAAEHFITATTLQALSGRPVWTSQWDTRAVPGRTANAMAHIELSREADLILVAPASADFLAKLANGLANDLLSTTCLARDRHRTRLAVAPAMNREMWDNPATRRNVERLREDGVLILGPEGGEQACGETGLGRMREPTDLAADIESLFRPALLAGRRVLVTAGPTFEPIDPVRGITNRSSGKMGYELAAAARDAGARVTLISGPTALSRPAVDQFVSIESAAQLFDAVMSRIDDVDLFFSVAAVADYTPATVSDRKLKKSAQPLRLDLVATEDVLARVAREFPRVYCVGFAAESHNVAEFAAKKREKKGIPLIIANNAVSAIGSDKNEVTLIDATGQETLPLAPKSAIARQIIEAVARRLPGTAPRPSDRTASAPQALADRRKNSHTARKKP